MSLNYTTETDGRVEYQNHWGLTFYLPGQPPSRREGTAAVGARPEPSRISPRPTRVAAS
ncbi:MAG: hypothetical protein ACLGIN_05200 [Candidatus Sericytochromatia bacterium]